MATTSQLSTTDHATDKLGRKYVYAVVSRRTGGVSVGLNLNPNRACNFRCAYCQVPGLSRGGGPDLDLALLESELNGLLDEVMRGEWIAEHAPDSPPRLASIAFSGDGEPTTSPQFAQAIEIVTRVRRERDLVDDMELVLITNGSQTLKPSVQRGLRTLAEAGGDVWFKLDRGRDEDITRVNGTPLGREHALKCLAATARVCRTKIQSCWFLWDHELPPDDEVNAYLDTLREVRERAIPVAGVLLYGLARPSFQPEASRISRAPAEWMEALARRIEALDFDVETTP